MPESSSTFDLSFYSLSRLLLDPDPNGIKDQFVTCAVYELRPNCGRPVTGFPGQLRLHPALDELGWIGVTDEFNEAAGLTNQSPARADSYHHERDNSCWHWVLAGGGFRRPTGTQLHRVNLADIAIILLPRSRDRSIGFRALFSPKPQVPNFAQHGTTRTI
jgi:hypothetical protein